MKERLSTDWGILEIRQTFKAMIELRQPETELLLSVEYNFASLTNKGSWTLSVCLVLHKALMA